MVPLFQVIWQTFILSYGSEKLFGANTWWAAGISVQTVLVWVMLVPMVILEPLAYIDDRNIGIVYLTWVEFVYWYMVTAFWIGPLLMIVSQALGEEVKLQN